MSDFGIDPRELAEFRRRWEGSFTELQAGTLLEQGRKQGSLIVKNPEDKNAANYKKHKRKYEIDGFKSREEKMNAFLEEVAFLRRKEAMNKNDISYKDLLYVVLKSRPQKTEQKIEATMNFADMVKSVYLERETYKAVDAETVDKDEE